MKYALKKTLESMLDRESFSLSDSLNLRILNSLYGGYHSTDIFAPDKGRQISERVDKILGSISQPSNCIDLGCNGGLVGFMLAREGLIVTAIDGDPNMITICRLLRKKYKVKNISFSNAMIDEDFTAKIPTFDNTVYLAVHHDLIKTLGVERAENCLRNICTKTKEKLFFEMAPYDEAGVTQKGPSLPDMGSDPDDWISDHLQKAGFSNIEILGKFKTKNAETERTLFSATGQG